MTFNFTELTLPYAWRLWWRRGSWQDSYWQGYKVHFNTKLVNLKNALWPPSCCFCKQLYAAVWKRARRMNIENAHVPQWPCLPHKGWEKKAGIFPIPKPFRVVAGLLCGFGYGNFTEAWQHWLMVLPLLNHTCCLKHCRKRYLYEAQTNISYIKSSGFICERSLHVKPERANQSKPCDPVLRRRRSDYPYVSRCGEITRGHEWGVRWRKHEHKYFNRFPFPFPS